MVADVHRTIKYGGIFLYPASKSSPNGKVISFDSDNRSATARSSAEFKRLAVSQAGEKHDAITTQRVARLSYLAVFFVSESRNVWISRVYRAMRSMCNVNMLTESFATGEARARCLISVAENYREYSRIVLSEYQV